jgi:hypothetical protein
LEKLIRQSPLLSNLLEWNATRIGVKGEVMQWQAVARTARSVEAMQGEHRDHMLLVVDEASGVEDRILEALLGGLTEPHNVALLISNPTTPYGIFYDSHTKDSELWERQHYNSRDSPLVAGAHVLRMERKYGGKSPIIQVRVDGEFPSQTDNSLIQLRWLEEARTRGVFPGENGDIQVGVDVARYGADSSAVCVRQGRNILHLETWHGSDLVETSGRVIDICKQWENVVALHVDSIGVGAGVVDNLSQQQLHGALVGVTVNAVNVGEASSDTSLHPLLRDELWFNFGKALEDGQIAFSPNLDEDLLDMVISEVSPVEFLFKPNGSRAIESKDSMRKKTGKSPDLADAIMLSFCEGGGGFMGWL